MALRVVGAGLGRTGTNSLKLALERLLGGRCYHMVELIERPSDTEYWERAAAGEFVTWDWLRQDYVATAVPADRPDWARRRAMNLSVLARLTPEWRRETDAIFAYERHNEEVRRTVPSDRLIDWRPGDGWQPICSMLGVAVPLDPLPHENTTADFQARIGVSAPDPSTLR